MTRNGKVVVITSGGMDSTTMLYKARDEFKEVHSLSFDYGQKHRKELECAKETCRELNVKWHLVDLKSITKLLSSSLTDDAWEVPEGHYASENMKQTVVPNRNTIMLSIAYAYALSIGADVVWFGAHSGDHAIYPDCRQSYINKLSVAFEEGNWPNKDTEKYPIVEAPFIKMTKGQIVVEGLKLEVPYEGTWSCYKGGERHCGKCGTCVERIEAFQQAGAIDPVEYEITIDWNNCKKV